MLHVMLRLEGKGTKNASNSRFKNGSPPALQTKLVQYSHIAYLRNITASRFFCSSLFNAKKTLILFVRARGNQGKKK